MNPSEYQVAAARTEAPVTDELLDRLEKQAVAVRAMFSYAANTGEQTEALKKHIFYNKEPEGLAELQGRTYSGPIDLEKFKSNVRIIHGVLGLISEVGEIAQELGMCLFQDHTLDRTNRREELGDLEWYVALLCNAQAFDLGTILEANIAKLKKRFPGRFTEEEAQVRDTAAERSAVEETSDSSSDA